jgi:hypothetical protein
MLLKPGFIRRAASPRVLGKPLPEEEVMAIIRYTAPGSGGEGGQPDEADVVTLFLSARHEPPQPRKPAEIQIGGQAAVDPSL